MLGTNISIGELQGLECDLLPLSNPIVLLDEAGQASEPSALVPLTLGAEWVLMAADLKQLRPTIRTDMAKKQLGYNTEGGGSLYGRSVSVLMATHHQQPLTTALPAGLSECLARPPTHRL